MEKFYQENYFCGLYLWKSIEEERLKVFRGGNRQICTRLPLEEFWCELETWIVWVLLSRQT